MKKRILAVILSLAMLLPVFAVGASAAAPEEDAKRYLTEVFDVFSGGTFTIKARGASPFGGNKQLSLSIMMDGDRLAMEFPMDWVQFFQLEGRSKLFSRLAGWGLQLVFGNTIRIVTTPEQMLIVFPSRRMYIIAMPGPFDESLDIYVNDALSITEFLDGRSLTVSEPVINGKKYLCATVENEGATVSYYFLDGKLKRIDTNGSVMEVDELKAAVDESLFSIKGMFTLPLDWLGRLLPL